VETPHAKTASEEAVPDWPKARGLDLADFPLAALGPVRRGSSTLAFEAVSREGRAGPVSLKLTITAPDAADLPTPVDEEVLFGLVQLSRAGDHFTRATVSFTRYGLIQLLGWPDNGPSYRRLDRSLARWLGVTLTYEETTPGGCFRQSFRVLEAFSEGSITWATAVFDSLQAEYWTLLDLGFCSRLHHTLARRAYRFLARHMVGGTPLDLDLREFACGRLGISRGHDAGKLKAKLRPALEELELMGFLEPLAHAERYARAGRGRWRVLFLRRHAQRRSRAALRALERGLTDRGVSAATATELVAANDPGRIRAKLHVFDWLRERGQTRLLGQDPPGYLVGSIREDLLAAGRTVTNPVSAQRSRIRGKGKSGARPAQRDSEGRQEEGEPTAIDRYWNSLSAPEQEWLTREALEEADPWLVERYQSTLDQPHLARHFLQAILDRHMGGLLRGQAVRDDGRGSELSRPDQPLRRRVLGS
jgi:hypothetical protein